MRNASAVAPTKFDETETDVLIGKCVQQVIKDTALKKMWQFIDSCGVKGRRIDNDTLMAGIHLTQPSGERCHLILIPSRKIIMITPEGSSHDIIYDFGAPVYTLDQHTGAFSCPGLKVRLEKRQKEVSASVGVEIEQI